MAWIRVVEVTCATSDTSKTVTGLPSQPKGIVCLLGAGTAIQTRPSFSFGFADGTTQGCSAWRMTPSATSDEFTIFQNSMMGCVWNGSTQRNFTLSSLTSDGFTFAISGTLQGTTVARFLVFGGASVSAHVRATSQTNSGSPYSQTGIGFEPTALLGLFSQVGGGATFGSLQAWGQVSLALFDGTTKRAHIAAAQNGQADSNTSSAAQTGEPLTLNGTGFSLVTNVGLSSLDAGGYTWSQSSGSTTVTLFLALAGIDAAVLPTTVPSSTGTVALTGAGFTPTGALVVATPTATSASFSDHAMMSVGLQSQTTAVSVGAVNWDALASTEPQVLAKSDSVVYGIDRTGASTFADRCVAEIQSYDSDGLTLNWTDADATAGLVSVLAFRATDDAASGAVHRVYY